MDFTAFLAGLDDKGQDLANNARSRLRVTYMAAKAYGKFQDWTPGNDKAFDTIDVLVAQLVTDAGFESRGKAATLSNEELVKQAIEAGYNISPRAPAPPVNPLGRNRPLVNAETLEAAIRDA